MFYMHTAKRHAKPTRPSVQTGIPRFSLRTTLRCAANVAKVTIEHELSLQAIISLRTGLQMYVQYP